MFFFLATGFAARAQFCAELGELTDKFQAAFNKYDSASPKTAAVKAVWNKAYRDYKINMLDYIH